LKIFGSIGPLAGIAQFVKLEVENLDSIMTLAVCICRIAIIWYYGIIYACGLSVAVYGAGLRPVNMSWKGA